MKLDNKKFIPLSAPSIYGNEKKYIFDCIKTKWLSTSGSYVDKFEYKISKYTKSKFAIACNSGTSALHISLIIAGATPGDEVIVPTLTFVATINVVRYLNCNPIFMDSDDSCNIDIKKTIEYIQDKTIFKNNHTINAKTKKRIIAIIVVHVWGNIIDFLKLKKICKKRNIKIIEDASESLGSFYDTGEFKGKHTGTIGDFGCISFNGNKIITCGGGGVILTQVKKLADKAKYLTNQAKNDQTFFIHNEIGYNYRLTNIQAAVGLGQLEKINKILKKKKEIHNFYLNHINKISGLKLLSVSFGKVNYWMNVILVDREFKYKKEKLIKIFQNQKIETRPIWFLNHQQKYLRQFEKYKIVKAKELIKKGLCLPSSFDLRIGDLKRIVKILDV